MRLKTVNRVSVNTVITDHARSSTYQHSITKHMLPDIESTSSFE